jgi:hypothetical protein
MTDIEREVSNFFHEEAEKASPSPGMYERVLGRSKTRRLMTSLAAGVAAIAILAGAAVAVGVARHATTSRVAGPPSLTPPTPLSAGEIARIPVGDSPQPIAANNEGAWVVTGTGETTSVLWHIDARTQRAVEVPGTRGSIWPGVGERFVWVTCNGAANPCGGSSVLKLDPRTGRRLGITELPGATYSQVAVGLGAVWVATTKGLVKIDPLTAKIVATYPIDANYLDIAGSSLWATRLRGQQVVQIDPKNGQVVHRLRSLDPCQLVATEQGVWVSTCLAESGGDWLTHIDPATGRVTYRVPLKSSSGLVFGHGQIWIARWVDNHVKLEARNPSTGELTGTNLTIMPGPQPWQQYGIGPPGEFIGVGADSIWLTHIDAADVVRVGLGPH